MATFTSSGANRASGSLGTELQVIDAESLRVSAQTHHLSFFTGWDVIDFSFSYESPKGQFLQLGSNLSRPTPPSACAAPRGTSPLESYCSAARVTLGFELHLVCVRDRSWLLWIYGCWSARLPRYFLEPCLSNGPRILAFLSGNSLPQLSMNHESPATGLALSASTPI